MFKLLLRIILLCLCVGLLYRLFIIAPGIPISVMTRAIVTENQLLEVVESNPKHAFGHHRLAELALIQNDDEMAEHHALATLLNNPANGMAMMILMQLSEKDNKPLAYEAVKLGSNLWPAHDRLQWSVAAYWARQNDLYRAMDAWNVVLSQEPEKEFYLESTAALRIFPIFETLVNNKKARVVFDEYILQRPRWWMEFFKYLQSQPNNYNVVNYLYNKMGESRPHSQKNVDDFIGYLAAEGRWNRAFKLWKRQYVDYKAGMSGMINNGSFEANHFNDLFSWNITNYNKVRVRIDKLSVEDGAHSLKVSLNDWTDSYWGYIWQLFVLPEGRYRLQFKARASLDSVRGLKWRLECKGSADAKTQPHVLSVSKEVIDSPEWKSFSMTFKVPRNKSCKAQKLYLITAGSSTADQRVRGDVWFDSFSLSRY
ncbi:MAG: carbohydrate binding domain-containing protein [Thiotrichaceae bacterium]|nr:carbohydrate binding domain-containing protein [Thiotrichaceae bacterium]